MSVESATEGSAHHAQVDLVSSQPKRVVIVVANPVSRRRWAGRSASGRPS